MRMVTWLTDTVQGSLRKRARLVSMRWSLSRVHASWDASVSRAGEMARRIVDTQLSASRSEYASQEPNRVGGNRSSIPSVQHSHQNPLLVVILSMGALPVVRP
ncbi:hypothetical protein ABZT04_41465 [Streptomyces sp. NPDC005492]|uniref:hypothetical protein n=1 Tax=Streptomyces sp. NPDC005492 TaxID=3156883 RepID=UPI0033B1A3C8